MENTNARHPSEAADEKNSDDLDEDDIMDENSSESSNADHQPEEPPEVEDDDSDSESEEEFEGEPDAVEGSGMDGDRELSMKDVETLIKSGKVAFPPSLVVDSDQQEHKDDAVSSVKGKKKKKTGPASMPDLSFSPLPSPLPVNPPSTSQVPPFDAPEETHFTQKTIRRVMSYLTSSHDVRISHPSVKAVSVALECFIQSLTQEAFRHAQRSNRNQIKYSDLAYVANHFSPLYFLQEYLPPPQPAGFVVRKILDSAGVDVQSSFAVDESEGLVGQSEEAKESSTGSLTSAAMNLAKKWDKDPDCLDWRLTPAKMPSSRGHKRPKSFA